MDTNSNLHAIDQRRSVRRTKSLQVDVAGPDLVRFFATLEDRGQGPEGPEVIHSLELEGTLSLPDLVIRSIEARALKQPYTECADSVTPMAGLVGISISAGFSSRVKDLLGGTRGCSHFLSLALDVAASHTLTMYLRMRTRAKLDESNEDGSSWTRAGLAIEPRLENACIALDADKRVVTLAKRKGRIT
jgi:hypothetical protein